MLLGVVILVWGLCGGDTKKREREERAKRCIDEEIYI